MLYRLGFDIEASSSTGTGSAGVSAAFAGVGLGLSGDNELSYDSPASVYVAFMRPTGGESFELLNYNGEAEYSHDVNCAAIVDVEPDHIDWDESTGIKPELLRAGIVSFEISGAVSHRNRGFCSLKIEQFLGGGYRSSGCLLIRNLRASGELHGSFSFKGFLQGARSFDHDIRQFLLGMGRGFERIRPRVRDRH